jgi:hypothetical protein
MHFGEQKGEHQSPEIVVKVGQVCLLDLGGHMDSLGKYTIEEF